MKKSAIVIKPGMITHDRLTDLIKEEDKTFDPHEKGGWQIQRIPYSRDVTAFIFVSRESESIESELVYVDEISIFTYKTIDFFIKLLDKHNLIFNFESEPGKLEALERRVGSLIEQKRLKKLLN